MRRTVKAMISTVAAIMIFLGTAGPSEGQLLTLLSGRRRPPSPPPGQSGQQAAAPNPPPPSSGGEKRIVYSIPEQRMWLYEGQTNISNYPVSGRRDWPRPGNYEVFSKSEWATNGRVRMQYMVRFVRGRRLAIGFHSIPVGRRGPIQTEGQLGTYRSAGCVRQKLSDAARMWEFAGIGTPVVVLGH
jgi:lipoprotein-anchoring transpeptidase ErfK/SrfK